MSYLQALANPRDEVALYSVLASPLVGVSVDALVMLGRRRARAAVNLWWVLDDQLERLDAVPGEDRTPARRVRRMAARRARAGGADRASRA